MTAGFISKWMLLTAAFETERWPVAALMLISSLLALVYVWRVVETLYFSEQPSPRAKTALEAPLWMLVPTYLVIAAVLYFGVRTDFSAGLATRAAKSLLPQVQRTEIAPGSKVPKIEVSNLDGGSP
jgi:multicomponent Na+:H+ antiporter subunit D